MSKRAISTEVPSADELVPDPAVARQFGISLMSLWRWSRDQKLAFPAKIMIRGRSYRSRNQIEEFKQRMLASAIARRNEAA